MDASPDFFDSLALFLQYYHAKLWLETLQHALILLYSLPFAVAPGVALGFLVARRPRLRRFVIGAAGVIMTIPGLALFGLMVVALAPLQMGIGVPPAVAAIALYALLPIVRNTATALGATDPAVLEAARGMGLSERQILFRVQAPLGLPVIMAGVRSALVLGVGVAAFSFLVAAGGLGYFIFSGISRSNGFMVFAGALFISALGMGLNALLLQLEDWLTPRGLKLERGGEAGAQKL